jgi:3-oxoacyl-[acyl-carrier protein] reductase
MKQGSIAGFKSLVAINDLFGTIFASAAGRGLISYQIAGEWNCAGSLNDFGGGDQNMDLGLKGKNVLVTGGSKGIGLAVAELFAAEGANVAICARNAEQVNSVVKSLAAKGVTAWGDAVNVADPAALKRWVESAAAELRGIDILVCNVSALAVGNTAETWENSFRVDMMHTVNSVAAALPFLESSKSASIVIVSSVSGFEIDFAAGSYGAFKAALIHYAKGLSNQLIGKGIRVNAVSPGNTYFEGGIWQNIEKGSPDLYKMAMSLNPTSRMGTPQEVAAGVVFVASPVASRISGTNLIIDGALTKAV